MTRYKAKDNVTGETVYFDWDAKTPPTEDDVNRIMDDRRKSHLAALEKIVQQEKRLLTRPTVGIVTTENPVELLELMALPVLIVSLLILRRQHLKNRWTRVSVATKVELSVIKKSNRLHFLGELAVLLVIAFFVAKIMTNIRFVRDQAFIWLLIGLPTCFLLGRLWWRKYR